MDRFLNKIVLVTSASAGIGKAVVEELITKGLKVVGIDHELNKLNILMEELKDKPGKFYPLQCDMAVQSEIERAVLWVEKTVGNVDILINNAAINIDSSCINGEIEEFKKTLDINVLGLMCVTKETLKLMKRKGIDNGCIVNINDVCGPKCLLASGRLISPACTCSEYALTAITECLRLELAQNESNIKVINVCPGLVETDITAQWLKENPRVSLKPRDVADAIICTLLTLEPCSSRTSSSRPSERLFERTPEVVDVCL